ncbi:MAG: 2'-5' RNA ligase family protein [Microgenomates group bacterium]
MKYCAWIIPPQPAFDELNKIISNLSAEYKGPVFKPHMTLLGSTECELDDIRKAVEAVAKNTKKLSLSLGPVSFSTTYYQSVLVRVNSTAQLMQFNLNLKKALGIENNVFMPHISLMYGDHDMKMREEIAAKIKLQNTSFVADSIVIVPVAEKSEPKDWEPVATIPLVG